MPPAPQSPSRAERSGQDERPARRSFLTSALAVATGVMALMGPVASAVGFLFSPLWRRTSSAEPAFVRLPVSPRVVPSDGTPLRVQVAADRVDAWNYYQQQRIGSVWLSRRNDGSIQAFSTVCPHLGCSVEFRSASRDFFCPCHASVFSLDGQRSNQIPPRGMDELQVRVENDRVWVQYLRFRGGIPEKEPV